MKRLTRTLVLMSALLGLACPVKAGGYYLQVYVGYAIFGLDDVNDSIDRFNEETGGETLDHIYSGPIAGLQAGLALTAELDLGIGYSRQWASSGISHDGYLIEYDLPADLFEISLDYLPAGQKKTRFGAGTALGVVSSDGSLLVSEPGVPDWNPSFDGLGFLFRAYALVDAPISPAWSMVGQLGFRHALLNHLKVDGETVYNPDSLDDKLRFNYTGLFLSVGVKFRP